MGMMPTIPQAMRARQAQQAFGGPSPEVRAIEIAANEKYPDDMAARFAYRNELRQAAGLPPEKRKRGGFAGQWDTGFLPAAAAIIAAPFALGGAGAAGAAGGAGSAGAGAAGAALPTAIPAASSVAGSGGFLGTLGSLAGKAQNAINSPLGKTLTQLGTAAYGIGQQNKANKLTANAIEADKARWQAGAPLRAAGSAAMLNPVARDTSSLDALARRGNPFAIPAGGSR